MWENIVVKHQDEIYQSAVGKFSIIGMESFLDAVYSMVTSNWMVKNKNHMIRQKNDDFCKHFSLKYSVY